MKILETLATIALTAALANAQTAVAPQRTPGNCLYCRQQDASSGWLQQFDYCQQNDECLEDQWNYINKGASYCPSGWIRGKDYMLDYCAPVKANCTGFVSDSSKFNVYTNLTSQTLAAGAYCELTIDATKGLARVIFDGYYPLDGLGIMEVPMYTQGDILTFVSGENVLTLYNANKNGQILFDISYSGASTVFMGFGAVISTLLAAF